MDPFTIALAVFGVSKLTGSSTKNSLRNAFLAAVGTQLAGMGGVGGFEAFGSTGNVLAGEGLMAQLGNTAAGSGIAGLFSTAPAPAPVVDTGLKTVAAGDTAVGITTSPTLGGSTGIPNPFYKAVTPEPTTFFDKAAGLYKGLDPAEKIGLGVGAATYLGSEEPEEPKIPEGMSKEDYERAMAEAEEQIEGVGKGATYSAPSTAGAYDYGSNSLYTFNQGGIVSVMKKFSQGGINYLPSKVTHDENDVHNYVRATGYVEDGSGTGNKDEDTILAQLADGEFVSRSDAILGAGILAGASPTSYKDMRKQGAAFFYDQQAKFKRIFDLLDASRKPN
jgi:hypothetical protein